MTASSAGSQSMKPQIDQMPACGQTSLMLKLILMTALTMLTMTHTSVIATDSKQRAKKGDFDTHGEIPCAQERGQALGQCTVEVAHGDDGDTTVVVSFANGFRRNLYFDDGKFITANATMSGSGSDTDWLKEGDVHFIRVDDQRYEIPNHLVFNR